jgi:two-component system alkaline phosphatase synthesis response regulator PhoP
METKTILLIEDDVFISDLYKHVLERAGFIVLIALDGEEGLKLANLHPNVGLVFLDIMLPKIHGVEVLKSLKKEKVTKDLQIVMMSNLGEEDIIKATLRFGARDYIKKVHITPQQLAEAANQYLKDPHYTFNS